MTIWKKIAAALFVAAIAGVPEGALAAPNGAGHYWGLDAGTGGAGGGSESSSALHYTDAALAGQVNLAKINTNILLKYSEKPELDPYAVSGRVSLALLEELMATASIIGRV